MCRLLDKFHEIDGKQVECKQSQPKDKMQGGHGGGYHGGHGGYGGGGGYGGYQVNNVKFEVFP